MVKSDLIQSTILQRLIKDIEELAIIRPLRGSTTSMNCQCIESGAAIQLPAPHLMLRDTSTASSSTTQLAIANGERNEGGLPVADLNAIIPTISNRVTTLSTMGSVESSSARLPHDFTPELDITEVEGSTNTTETLEHQGTDPEEMT
jgi:hypothetical protein